MKKALLQIDLAALLASFVWMALVQCFSTADIINVTASKDAPTSVRSSSLSSSPSPPESDRDTLVGSQCFQVRGVPTLRLQCPPTESGRQQLIRVRQVFYGVPGATTTGSGTGNTTCGYRQKENHCVQIADLPPGHQCNGQSHCSVHVSNPYLMNCRQYAVYMQINYTCVPRADSIDVCSTSSHEASQGYLRSPSYPDVPIKYPAVRQLCRCQLRAVGSELERSSTVITLRILDLALTIPGIATAARDEEQDEKKDDEVNDPCRTNYLHVTGLDRRCGGQMTVDTPEMTDVDIGGDDTLVVEFRSDSSRQQTDRGFWIDFSGSEGSKIKITCEMLWSEEIVDLGGPPNNYRPKPVTPAPASVGHDVITTTTSSLDGATSRHSSQVETSDGHHANSDDYDTTLINRRRQYDIRPKENEFRLHDVQVHSAQPGLPWLPWPGENDGKLETDNMTVVKGRLSASVERVPSDRLLLQSVSDGKRRTHKEHTDMAAAYARSRDSTTSISGQTFFHRDQLVEHRVQGNYSHDQWLGFDEMRKSAAAFIGDGSEIFENHDFSRARKSLKLNVDEVQIITGIVIGILILVAICIIIILVFRRK